MKPLWESKHPYYATEGCYYVSGTLGHQSVMPNGRVMPHDGNTCHTNYASWQDFKDGKEMPFTPEQLATRKQFGIDDAKIAEDLERWKAATGDKPFSFIDADKDYNLLYRWDWETPSAGDYDEPLPPQRLKLFYMLQRKARPASVHVLNITREDEPEIRAFLKGHWEHLQRLWAPLSDPK